MVTALERACAEADEALARGVNILILSDRAVSPERAPIPSLLAVAGVHHHLVREGTRLQTGLVLESGEPREVHHFATLIGYGASRDQPVPDVRVARGRWSPTAASPASTDFETAQWNVVKGIAKGLLKTISKMGISTIQSYNGAQIFEAVGLDQSLIDALLRRHRVADRRHRRRHPRASRRWTRHARGFGLHSSDDLLPVGGVYAWRREGEHHMWNPETIALLQHSVRHGGQPTYDEYSKLVNEDAARRATLRGLLKFRELPEDQWLDIDDVEPASEIVKRFVTGAMSLGSISRETHETLAIAMNRLGGKSNTGEGGEDPVRFTPDPNGDRRRSAIKQVASGRFGVNINYLVNADELQIKMAQGAKPGEGGQLPGHKVDRYIGSIRFTTPGVGLISPPPHHDIYSIEDLKQLIYDLRCANPGARVSVKLVSEVGVGTVAAGVAKANADHVLIAGHDGGTGASPLSSIQAAGIPWEIGLAETQQTLVLNDLRSRIWVQTDGQLKTGRDVVVAALLGADECGFSHRPADRDGLHHDARLPPEHVPGGHRDAGPGAAQALQGPARARRELLLLRRRGGAAADAPPRHLDVRGSRRPRRPARGRRRRSSTGRAAAWTSRTCWPRRPVTDDAPRRRLRPQDSPLPGALDWTLIEAAKDAIDHRMPVTGDVRRAQRQPHRRRPALERGDQGARRRGPAARDDPLHAARLGRAVVRRVAGARRRAGAVRRRQRLHGQGPLRRRAVGPPARGRDLQGRGERRDRQHRALRGDVRAARSSAASRASASRCATRAPRGRRGRRRPRLRVHDRRARRHPRPHRAATSPPA